MEKGSCVPITAYASFKVFLNFFVIALPPGHGTIALDPVVNSVPDKFREWVGTLFTLLTFGAEKEEGVIGLTP